MQNRTINKSVYLTINIIFFILIGLTFIYVFLFVNSATYSIKSGCKDFPELCISKGLSRAFLQILHGNFNQALRLNSYGIKIFSFFALQLLFRVFFSLIYFKYSKINIIRIDIFISAIFFFYTFVDFFVLLLKIAGSILSS